MFQQVDRQKLLAKGIVVKAQRARLPKVLVTDAYLKPLAGAKVYIRPWYGLLNCPESFAGTTNGVGRMTVPLYAGGRYTLTVKLQGYCPRATDTPVVGDKSWIDLIEIVTEPATAELKGKVVDHTGRPVAGVSVATDFGPKAVTDSNGEFVLKQMPSWSVSLQATKGKLRGNNVGPTGRLMPTSRTVITLR